LEFLFQSDAPDLKVDFNVGLSKQGALELKAVPADKEALIVVNKKLERRDDGRNLDINGTYHVKFHDMAIFAPVAKPITELKLKKDHVSFEIGAVKYPEIMSFKLMIKDKNKTYLDSVLKAEDVKITKSNYGSKVVVSLKKHQLSLKLLKKYQVKIDVQVDFNGEILNSPMPSKTQSLHTNKRRW
jgi:hypothetical protein